MKKYFRTVLAVLVIMCLICLAACNAAPVQTPSGGNQEIPNNSGDNNGNNSGDISDNKGQDVSEGTKILVAYFSATGNTKSIAEKIAAETNGALYEIVPVTPYTSADLNYNNSGSRANKEQNDDTSRPAIADGIDVSKYDTVFVGYLIWWGKLPKILYTFFDANDFSGKTVIPFCTSGSSGISVSVGEIKGLEPSATVINGNRFAASASETDVKTWVDGLDIAKNEVKTLKAYCGDNKLEIELADTVSAKALVEKLKESDITIAMHGYGDFEMVGEMGFSLNRSDEETSASVGDVVLYGGNQIVMFYGDNRWAYTRIGSISGATREAILAFFGGTGEVTVRFSIK